MPRVKRGTLHIKKRRKLLKRVKGFNAGRKNQIKAAKTASLHAGAYAYRDRRNKKRRSRNLWQIKINAAAREHGVTYSRFIAMLKVKNVGLDRKILAQLAETKPAVFAKIIASVK